MLKQLERGKPQDSGLLFKDKGGRRNQPPGLKPRGGPKPGDPGTKPPKPDPGGQPKPANPGAKGQPPTQIPEEWGEKPIKPFIDNIAELLVQIFNI